MRGWWDHILPEEFGFDKRKKKEGEDSRTISKFVSGEINFRKINNFSLKN
jgi:hypothetical protein